MQTCFKDDPTLSKFLINNQVCNNDLNHQLMILVKVLPTEFIIH